MRRVLILAAALIIVAPSLAVAQSPDTIGLWFDPDYTVNMGPIQFGVPFQAYLVLHHPTAAVAGFEFVYESSEPSLIVLQGIWHPDAIVFFVDDCTVGSFPTPVPAQPAILLTTFTYLVVTSPQDIHFGVTACDGNPCPLYLNENLEPVCLETSLGGGWVACLGDCPVGTETFSWSAVKSLYR